MCFLKHRSLSISVARLVLHLLVVSPRKHVESSVRPYMRLITWMASSRPHFISNCWFSQVTVMISFASEIVPLKINYDLLLCEFHKFYFSKRRGIRVEFYRAHKKIIPFSDWLSPQIRVYNLAIRENASTCISKACSITCSLIS